MHNGRYLTEYLLEQEDSSPRLQESVKKSHIRAALMSGMYGMAGLAGCAFMLINAPGSLALGIFCAVTLGMSAIYRMEVKSDNDRARQNYERRGPNHVRP